MCFSPSTLPDPQNPATRVPAATLFSRLPFPAPVQAGFAAAGERVSPATASATPTSTSSRGPATEATSSVLQQKAAFVGSRKKPTRGLGLLSPANLASRTILGTV